MLIITQTAELNILARKALMMRDLSKAPKCDADSDAGERVFARMYGAQKHAIDSFFSACARFEKTFNDGVKITADQLAYIVEWLDEVETDRARVAKIRTARRAYALAH